MKKWFWIIFESLLERLLMMLWAYRSAHGKQFFTAAKIVQNLQQFEQKQRRLYIVQEMLTTFNHDPDLLKKLITSYESWVCGYDIETKAQ